MNIVMGLGNTGKKYEGHRHNVGFMVLDKLALEKGVYFNPRTLLHAHMAEIDERLKLVKPGTFMNDSGVSAKQALKHYDASLVVVYDDISIPLGSIKCSFGNGSGGHNGVQSIIDHLGYKEFFRIRVGVRPVHSELQDRILPPDGFETFLLSNFAPFEKELLEEGIQKALYAISLLSNHTPQEIMNACN